MDARTRIATCLGMIYGDRVAAETLPRVLELVEGSAGRIPAPTSTGWSERDAILITYADQVRELGKSPLAALNAFCLESLQGLLSGIHLLPFYPSSSDDGFSVVDYRRVDPDFGSWDDIAGLGRSFRLMFDAVVNHASVQSGWFQAFLRREAAYTEYFITPPADADLMQVIRPRTSPLLTTFPAPAGAREVWTTFGADQADLNYGEPRLLLEILDVLLDYARRGASLLRLDAVAFLWKEPGTSCLHLPQTHALVRLFRAVLDLAAPHVLLVTEANVPHPENVSYFGDGRDEAQMVYNFALPPLVLDAFAHGSGEALSRWAAGLQTPGEHTTFLNFLASHDGVGLNPARGLIGEDRIEALVDRARAHGGQVSMKSGPDGSRMPYELNINYFDALSNPQAKEPLRLQVDRFIAAQAVMLALAGVPGVYFHSLVGSRGWPEGVRQTGQPRTVNRQKLERRQLEHELRQTGARRAQVFQRFARLLRARQSATGFHPNALQTVLDLGEAIFGLVRVGRDTGEPLVCLHNLSDRRVTCPPIGSASSEARPTRWTDVIRGSPPRSLEGPLLLAPYQVLWMRPQRWAGVTPARSQASPFDEVGT